MSTNDKANIALGFSALALLLAGKGGGGSSRPPGSIITGSKQIIGTSEILVVDGATVANLSLAHNLNDHTLVSVKNPNVADLIYIASGNTNGILRMYGVGNYGILITQNSATADGITFTKDEPTIPAFFFVPSYSNSGGNLPLLEFYYNDLAADVIWDRTLTGTKFLVYDPVSAGYKQKTGLNKQAAVFGGEFFSPMVGTNAFFGYQWPIAFHNVPNGTPTFSTYSNLNFNPATLAMVATGTFGGTVSITSTAAGRCNFVGQINLSSD